MDLAYNQHADRARRKNRSSTNINHLTLAPLTVKLPLNDPDSLADLTSGGGLLTSSYLEGKSAPTTPRFLGHAAATPRSRSQHRTSTPYSESLIKSRSSMNLGRAGSGTSTPRRRRRAADDEASTLTSRHRNDSDWMLRTGALLSSEARESKGQAWLVSRQSSTSLTALRDGSDDSEDAFAQERARERRRGSTDDASSPALSRRTSRFASRAQSMDHNALRSSAALTPMDRGSAGDSYFPVDDAISGPDFVNLDQKLEELERDNELDDEAAIRRLMREGKALKGSWIASFIGWSLFEEDGDDDSDEGEDEEEEEGRRGTQTPRHIEGITNLPAVKLSPPKESESSWNDAAWLLSLASKVVF
ncbi:hypothetical protein CCM_01536 [Cordyceps militaris CM01]|uniref:Uncharacterized protein n=1 Tax=Cordyceps militaris (strain CM01) TaxID=983644 RepID=G3J5M2_CORMM|nr:uncharacterized protein CCM_01536 [Cordyceps militaris CM01]EGX96878.1 hypothetical protein CCM_01536 [Cordyceps militaris CM01]